MTKIISVMNQKGGCGKSTVSQHVAICIASKQAKRVLFVDTDRQGTALKFFERNKGVFPNGYDGVIDYIASNEGELQDDLNIMAKDYDYVFIDTAPRLGTEMGLIISVSDLVLIVCQPKLKDIEATHDIIEAVKSHQLLNSSIKSAFLISRYRQNTNIDLAIDDISKLNVPVLATKMREYNAYDEADRKGVSIIHMDDKYNADKAACDIHHISNELIKITG